MRPWRRCTRLGKEKIVSASCYGDMALARTAEAGGASYVAFGGFYPSLVKKYPVSTPLDIVLQAKREIALPCIGDRRHDAGQRGTAGGARRRHGGGHH